MPRLTDRNAEPEPGRRDQAPPEDAVAVVGLACRLPAAPTPAAFWALLESGGDAVGEVPAGRWDAAAWAAGPAGGRGAFLDRVDEFDAAFFGVSPREAAAMDPQQRLVGELAWEALEDAGLPPDRLDAKRVGVFVGAIWDDYATLATQPGRPTGRYAVTGLSRGLIANRVSYLLGLRGPSLVVDTAQSSSLVAIHLACESLRSGASTVALAGGVNLNLAPQTMLGTERFGALSPDGRCYTFDARANGYVRGEGAGVVVLKPLAAALADGDPVYCVILGGAVNNDGTGGGDGITVPDAAAQAAVLRAAWQRAGIGADALQYVELHGTGTRVGDPVEAAALGAALAAGPTRPAPLRVGSAKTNVGHLEGAAGVVGLLKAALSIHHRWLPASLNYQAPNPAIPLDDLGLRVQHEPSAWPRPTDRLVAGVSSFGMGGTNCHLVLGAPPDTAGRRRDPAGRSEAPGTPETPGTPDTPVVLGAPPVPGAAGQSWAGGAPVTWPLSARGQAALRAQARQVHAFAAARPELDPALVAAALAHTRSGLPDRAAVVSRDRAALLDGLARLADGDGRGGGTDGTRRGGGAGVARGVPPPSCSPGRAASGRAWAGSCTPPTRSSPPRSTRWPARWTHTSTGRCATSCSRPPARPRPPCWTRPATPRPRCSRSRWRCTGWCAARGSPRTT
jgi:acyl transferase domain-containing protein